MKGDEDEEKKINQVKTKEEEEEEENFMRPLDQKLPILNSQMQFKENGLSVPLRHQKNNQRSLTSKVTLVSSAISTLGLGYLAYQYYRKKGNWPYIVPITSTTTTLKNFATLGLIGALVGTLVYLSKKTGFTFFVNTNKPSHEYRFFSSKNIELMHRFEEIKKLFSNNRSGFETEFNKFIKDLKKNGIESNKKLVEDLIAFIKNVILYRFSLGTGTPLIADIVKTVYELVAINKHKALEIAIACVEEQNAEKYPSCQEIATATLKNQDWAVEFAIACADSPAKSEWCKNIAKNALGEFLKLDTENKTTLAKEYILQCTERDHDICQNAVIDGFNAILLHNKDDAAEIAVSCANHLFSKKNVLRKENKNVVFYVCEQVRNVQGIDKDTNESFLKVAKIAAKSLSSVKVETLIYSIEGIRRPKYQKKDAFHILSIKFQELIRSYTKHRSEISLESAYSIIKKCLNSESKELQTFAEQISQDLKNHGMGDLQTMITEESKENKWLPYRNHTKYLSF